MRRYFPAHYGHMCPQEEWLDHSVAALLECQKGAFIDVGTNMGQSLFKLLSIDPERRYVGFEPNLLCCFHVARFFEDNGLKNHMVFPIGLSDHWGMVELLLRDEATDTGSIVSGFRPPTFYSQATWVAVAPADTILPRLGLEGISLVKIDVEGGELEVLRGMRVTLEQHRPSIIFEVLPNYLMVTRQPLGLIEREFREQRLRDLEQVLCEAGYALWNVASNGVLESVSSIEPGAQPNLSAANYLALPGERVAKYAERLPIRGR